MVVLLDLDDDDAFDPFARPRRLSGLHTPYEHASATTNVKDEEELKEKRTAATNTERPNPNLNAFSTALGCYPIITLLASNLDLNTLDALSLTCRQFRHNLLPNRALLIQQTLRCANETPLPPSPSNPTQRLLLESPCNPCARDLVSSCRRASQEVEVEYCCEKEGGPGSGSSSGEDESDGERYWMAEGDGMGKEERAGYWQQEIEGIGGVVKKKVRKRIRVGKTVKEWEDERDGKEDVLGRESRGEARSWCGWCGRVVWGEKDRQMFGAVNNKEV
ncbi:MAG: hypothetical protein Q9184_001032 [Pyrenodesmia sp. 2 TL-2023]